MMLHIMSLTGCFRDRWIYPLPYAIINIGILLNNKEGYDG